MQQIKIFKGIESEISQLEQRVNAFLTENGGRVIQLTGNIAAQSPTSDANASLGNSYTASDILIVVLYEKPDA